MKILIVTYAYAPDNAPRAYRWSSIAEYWAKQGDKVDVVCGWRAGDIRSERRAGVAVHRVGGKATETMRRYLGRRSHRDGTAASDARPRSGIFRIAKYAYDATWRKVYWPDYACLWHFPALRMAAALCRKQSYDAFITVSHPFTGHLVGLALRRRFPGLRWIADVGDPFSLLTESPCNNHLIYTGLNRWVDHRVCAKADAISVTVDSCRDAYVSIFPTFRDKFHVIPPLLPKGESGQIGSRRLLSSDIHARNLVFTGRLYRSLRSPDYLFSLVSELVTRNVKIHFHLFGDLNDCVKALSPYRGILGRNIHIHGMMSRREVLDAQRGADILVNIGNNSSLQLPSKVPEYIAAAKPILNIISTSEDSSARALADHPATLNIIGTDGRPNDLVVNEVLNFITTPHPMDLGKIEELTAPYRIEQLASTYRRLAFANLSTQSISREAVMPPARPENGTVAGKRLQNKR